jgi:predicted RNA binding protein YcfA (HicA-like mRNA interferase family)
MKAVSGKELVRIVEEHGWTLLRIQGSRHICGKPGNPPRLSIPCHGNVPLKKGLLSQLLKVAGLDETVLSRSFASFPEIEGRFDKSGYPGPLIEKNHQQREKYDYCSFVVKTAAKLINATALTSGFGLTCGMLRW